MQDLVAHGMKMYGMYKRHGNRVIINSRGDLIVKPSLIEISLLRVRHLAFDFWLAHELCSCARPQCQ